MKALRWPPRPLPFWSYCSNARAVKQCVEPCRDLGRHRLACTVGEAASTIATTGMRRMTSHLPSTFVQQGRYRRKRRLMEPLQPTHPHRMISGLPLSVFLPGWKASNHQRGNLLCYQSNATWSSGSVRNSKAAARQGRRRMATITDNVEGIDMSSPDAIAESAMKPQPSSTDSVAGKLSTAAVIGQGTYAAAAAESVRTSSTKSKPAASPWTSRYSIYQMDAATIQSITNIRDLSDLVSQIEGMANLDAQDIGPLLLPITRLTSMKQYGHDGAVLTERLLLTCLARLPAHVPDRYRAKVPSTTVSTTLTPWTNAPVPPTTSIDANNDTTDSIVWATAEESHYKDARDVRAALYDTGSHLSLRHDAQQQKAPLSPSTPLPYPTAAMYNRAIIAWGNLASPASAERAEKLFQLQLQEYTMELDYLKQQQQNMLQSDVPGQTLSPATTESEGNQLLTRLLPTEPFAAPPDRRCFKSLIRSWAVSQHVHGAARAFEILTVMEHLSGVPTLLAQSQSPTKRSSTNTGPAQNASSGAVSSLTLAPILPSIPSLEMPDRGTYNVVLSAYAKLFVLKHPHALKRVQEIVQRVHDLHKATGDDEFVLDGFSYVAIVEAYSKYIQFCNFPIDTSYSRDLLAIIETIHARIKEERLASSLMSTIEGPVSPPRSNRKELDGNVKKDDVDTSFLYPLSMTRTYSVLVEALVKTEPLYETLELADDIIHAMTGQRNRINTPADTSPLSPQKGSAAPIFIPYDVCCHVWPKHESALRVVQGWERSGLPHAEERIDRLLSAAVVDATYPRTFALNEALEVWCTSGWRSAPFLMERMLQKALERSSGIHNKPTGQSFGIVMKAWMRSKLNEAPHRAELVLKHMVHLYEDRGDTWFRPREVHLRYVFTCWLQRCKDGKRYDGITGQNLYPAEHCENVVRILSNSSWFKDMSTGQYAMAIRIWAQQEFASTKNGGLSVEANEPNFVQRAARILDLYAETLPEGEPIPAFPCNWVLEACCRVQPTLERRREAYDMAIETFRRCKHNARTFTLTVQVLQSQVDTLDEKHLSVIEDLCKESCASGLLTQDLIRKVADVVSAEALQRLFGVSYQMAQMLVAARQSSSSSSLSQLSDINTNDELPILTGNGLSDRVPSVLLIENLPREWSKHADTQRKLKENKVAS